MPSEPAVRRSSSSSGASSSSSNLTSLNVPKRSLYNLNPPADAPATAARAPSVGVASTNSSNVSLPSYMRQPGALAPQNEPVLRRASPLAPANDPRSHKPRQHSQGFFEPTLPSQTNTASLSASRIAAQTAMQHQATTQQLRHRSQTIPPPQDTSPVKKTGRDSPPPPVPVSSQRAPAAPITPAPAPALPHYQNGVVGGRALAATTAANLVFPKSSAAHAAATSDRSYHEPGHKTKPEKSKMKLFSKPKHIGISRDKDGDKRDKPLPSPNKLGLPAGSLSRMVNPSVTSLNDSGISSNSSMYTLPNSSVATVVPNERPSFDREREKDKEKDKEKHKHHFLSRQKLKLKDKDEHRNLPLSSANSNSRPLDPSDPHSLYSFAPSSPSGTAFGKSMSGLDLRHGGRALRGKKKEEKASAAAAAAAAHEASLRETEQIDWATGSVGAGSSSTFAAPSSFGSSAGLLHGNDAAVREALQGFGLQNMTSDDAWDFLKVKLLVLFEAEDIRIALEDLNKLVTIHIQRCVQQHMPSVVVEDLRDFLQTGFASLNHSIHNVPDENLIPHLVNLWTFTFGTILPFMQAVFLPLDLEFKGRGSIMSSREAKEFWGGMPNAGDTSASVGDELDVRNIVLVSFRDTVILARFEMLKAAFSRLSLERIDATISGLLSTSLNSGGSASRPSTSSAYDTGFGNFANFSSQSPNVNVAGSFSSDSIAMSLSRSRATSNTSSNPDQYSFHSQYPSFSPPQGSVLSRTRSASQTQPQRNDPSFVTETAGRMLQCISVLASVQTDDEAQQRVEELSKTLKHNWLGRGRTGRDRRGFVGTKLRPPPPPRKESDDRQLRHSVDGSIFARNGFDGVPVEG